MHTTYVAGMVLRIFPLYAMDYFTIFVFPIAHISAGYFAVISRHRAAFPICNCFHNYRIVLPQ